MVELAVLEGIMTTNESKQYYGSGTKLALALHISPQAIHKWGKYPPFARQCQIQVTTEGKLMAERAPEVSVA